MKIILIIFLFSPLCFCAQQKQNNFYYIDSKVESIPFATADTLAKQLAALGKNDIEKVRAIFRWITEHIDYNSRRFNRTKNTTGLFYEETDDSSAALPSLDERVAAKVLYKKIAFCDGYARLFKTLCDHAGIKAEVIHGYARTNTARRFAVNHTWNAVYIDSSWHLLDVTWASGSVTWANEYVKQYNDFYFLTPPVEFINDHYPEDPQWTLMTEPPLYREFNQSPFRHSGFIKAGINSFFPAKGILDVALGDTITIELKAKKEIRSIFVSESPVFDTSQVMILPPFYKADAKVSFKYNITPATGEWLYVFCNDELAMRYKLNIKKDVAIDNRLRQ
jgi:transglutaminase/protease-like cytokinesis protein 3